MKNNILTPMKTYDLLPSDFQQLDIYLFKNRPNFYSLGIK